MNIRKIEQLKSKISEAEHVWLGDDGGPTAQLDVWGETITLYDESGKVVLTLEDAKKLRAALNRWFA